MKQMMNFKVFIGYSSEDNDKAQYIYNCLARIVEITPYKAELYKVYGEDFKQRIQNELFSSQFMVVLLTENGKNSQWVNQEIGFAYGLRFQRHKERTPIIIPVSYKQVQLKGLITKDTTDFLNIDDWNSFEWIVANIILTIRRNIQKGLEEGVLHYHIDCPNCFNEKGLPYTYISKLPDNETMVKASNLGNPIFRTKCPQCKKDVLVDIRTLLPFKPPTKT